MGILDLDEIEQIGGGSISLSGTVQGNMGDEQLPVVRVNGEAKDLGFRIKPVKRDVTGISFRLFATNGSNSDLSEAYLEVQNFKAKFPEGDIYSNIIASNVKSPELNIEVDCAVNLEGLEEMFKSESISNLSGSVYVNGALSGNVNRESGHFLNEGGSLRARLDDVSFVLNQDSANRDSFTNINGELDLHDTIIEAEKLTLSINANDFDVGFYSENILLYLLDYERDVTAGISLAAEVFNPATLLRDSSIAGSFGEEIRDFYFSVGASVEKSELDDFMEFDSIPDMDIILDSFGCFHAFAGGYFKGGCLPFFWSGFNSAPSAGRNYWGKFI